MPQNRNTPTQTLINNSPHRIKNLITNNTIARSLTNKINSITIITVVRIMAMVLEIILIIITMDIILSIITITMAITKITKNNIMDSKAIIILKIPMTTIKTPTIRMNLNMARLNIREARDNRSQKYSIQKVTQLQGQICF